MPNFSVINCHPDFVEAYGDPYYDASKVPYYYHSKTKSYTYGNRLYGLPYRTLIHSGKLTTISYKECISIWSVLYTILQQDAKALIGV